MKRVLFIIPTLTQTNGVASFIINYIDKMTLDNFKVDVLYNNLRPSQKHIDFFNKNGINIYKLSYVHDVGLKKYCKEIKNFFKENNDYDLVYSNIGYQTYFFYKEAKKYTIRNWAIHAHATNSSDNKIKNLIGGLLQREVNRVCKYKFACSELAGRAIFKRKKFTVINNAIDYKKYSFSHTYRKKIRDDLNIKNNEKIIGFVGRFVPQKNIFFFINLIKMLPNEYRVIMIGNGIQKEEFLNVINLENLNDRFILINEISNVNEYYSAFDYFVLPSLFEGLPVVGVEAQANGLPCLFSDTISDECKISDNTVYLDKDNIGIWIENINKMERNDKLNLNNDFDIEVQAKRFKQTLSDIINE